MARQQAVLTEGPRLLDLGTLVPPANLRLVKTGATTLVSADSAALCLFNTAAGYTFTLPACKVGLWFDFAVHTTISSVAAKVITSSASEFLVGNFIQSTDGTYTSASQTADGTTIRAISMNGSTTGGLAGDWYRLTCISTTQWYIFGMGRATGTEATPFATS
jgi:hypothetical protein